MAIILKGRYAHSTRKEMQKCFVLLSMASSIKEKAISKPPDYVLNGTNLTKTDEASRKGCKQLFILMFVTHVRVKQDTL